MGQQDETKDTDTARIALTPLRKLLAMIATTIHLTTQKLNVMVFSRLPLESTLLVLPFHCVTTSTIGHNTGTMQYYLLSYSMPGNIYTYKYERRDRGQHLPSLIDPCFNPADPQGIT